MAKYFQIILPLLLVLVGSNTIIAKLDTKPWLDFAVSQYTKLSAQLNPTDFIHVGHPTEDHWETNEVFRWTVGFYPGTLWYLYKLTNDTKWSQLALRHSEAVKERQFDTSTHDVGFVIFASYGHALEFYNSTSEEFKDVIVTASSSLSTRFHELSGCIRSWNNDDAHGGEPGEVKVIADNMMNLELLFLASKVNNNQTYQNIAISHAEKTMQQHMRIDGGSFHAVAYNETTGLVRRKYTWQGYANDSTWARGQAWIIHGFTTCYRATNYRMFLATAEAAASYFISKLPPDFVPFWDFDVTFFEEYQPRDTSAATVAASALIDLYNITSNITYLQVAEKMLGSLMTANYRADGKSEYKIPAILVNGTVFYNENNLNTAIVYGDYYFLQAIDRYTRFVADDDDDDNSNNNGSETSVFRIGYNWLIISVIFFNQILFNYL